MMEGWLSYETRSAQPSDALTREEASGSRVSGTSTMYSGTYEHLLRRLRSWVQRGPMSEREERSKPARCPDQFGYEHEWLWRMAPSLATDRTCALRASSLATAGNGCCGIPLAAPLAMTRRGCVAACGDIHGIRQFTLGERSKVRGVGTTRCRLGGEFGSPSA